MAYYVMSEYVFMDHSIIQSKCRVEMWRGSLGLHSCFWLFRLPAP